ncbi:carboxypeptidase-like regulatory domain-containing protein [Paraliomyxa miuraensis]|uniref:carboxypeptidase-like regulatory domain-containing protein n=1 Tax=Paraliomyxa miuraensis TaxID=376150 RepID=UPI00225AF1B3|nr:carboxypeptidase-like regulatory domain-containing protein [Paraliomyxa miuraensis]MCX4240507.1 carboxypeptidase-like regulatory domain-containing protein [Paraliomyxa miuraensis]
MASCPICGETLQCAHATDQQHVKAVEATKQDCPVIKGAIWVQVLDDKGGGVEGVTVKAAGKSGTTDSSGFAPFDPLDAKAYDVEVTDPLPKSHLDGFMLPDTKKVEATVKAGEIVLVKFRLERINVVTPKIELEYKTVLFDRQLSKHQESTEPEKFVASATRIEVSLEQTNEEKYPFTKTAKLVCTPAHVDVFTDDECTKALDKDLEANDLTGDEPLSLYLRGKTKGKFKIKLELADPEDAHIKAAPEEKQPEPELGVVELVMAVHQHDPSAVKGTQVDPDQEPISAYHTALKDKALPDQKALTDEQKVKVGRLLHAQNGGNHGRGKLVLDKLDSSQWPDETDDYEVFIHATNTSGEVELFDAETDGTKQKSPAGPFTVKDLKAAEKVLWVEGKTSCKKLREVRLDVALDRKDGGLKKEIKRNADWARFTVVKIKEVKLDYTAVVGKANAWDATNNRFFINMKKGEAGRKIEIGAQLEEPIENVVLHFMLVEHKDNRKTANWGVDLPTGTHKWTWKDITADVKHLDKDDRKDIVHVTEKTGSTGHAKKEVRLSQFGGDKFYLAAYIEQDPHLGKYIDGHTELGKRKPVMCTDPIQVWRKFWYKELKVEGITVKDFGDAPDTYEDVKTIMAEAGVKEMTRSTADGLDPPVIYPKHMISYYVDMNVMAYKNNFKGNTTDGLMVGDVHEAKFWALAPAEADKPVMFRMLNANALWAPGNNTTAVNVNAWTTSDKFPLQVNVGALVIDPPQTAGAKLLTSGLWEAEDYIETPPPSGSPSGTPSTWAWGNARSGNLKNGDVTLSPNRDDPRMVQVNLPADVVVAGTDATHTRLKIKSLVVRSSEMYLGTSYAKGIVNAYTPNDEQDFINTINHELGHSLKQVTKVRPGGIPAHHLQYDSQGSHCNYTNKKCLMYESGPQPGSLNRYCPVCHPYLLVQDMSDV